MNRLRTKLIGFGAVLPMRGTANSAGLDLFASVTGKIMPGDRIFINTGIAVALPENTFGSIQSRSSLAKKGIDIAAGIIDADYRGVIKVLLVNNSKIEYFFYAGERIGQLIVQSFEKLEPIVVKELNETERGNNGFGSTGE